MAEDNPIFTEVPTPVAVKGPQKMDHAWPLPGQHFWTKWQHKTGLPVPTQYRTCIHPDCIEVQYRDTPKG